MIDEPDRPRFRSGTVARMAKMPAATLRIWERRYGISGAARSGSGQRLYSRRDLERVVLLRTAVAAGYAIGSIASLDVGVLKELVSGVAPDSADGGVPIAVTAVGRGWDPVATIDSAPVHWTHFDSVATCVEASTFAPVDWLLVREETIGAEQARALLDLADRSRVSCVAVAYVNGHAVALDVLRMAGVMLLRERDTALTSASVMRRLGRGIRGRPSRGGRSWGRAPRRFNDAELAELLRRSNVLACECPVHLADIVERIAGFERYSDTCANDSAEDALMHRYLGDVASRAREMFEQAMVHFDAVEALRAARR